MSHLSDDENVEETKEILTFEDEYPEEELDEETRAACFNFVSEEEIPLFKEKDKKEKVKKTDKNASMSLKNFIEKNEVKTKKWQSKRVETKKSTGEVKEKIVKRQFNPRLPPYKLVRKEYTTKEVLNINDKSMFPEMEKK